MKIERDLSNYSGKIYVSSNLLDQFREHLIKNGAAKLTVLEYSRQVAKFNAFAKNRELSQELISAYRVHVEESLNTPLSRNANISAVNSFLRFVGKEEYLIPLYDTDIRKYRNRANYILSKNEYIKLLEAAKKSKNKSAELILCLIAQTGIRGSEVGKITIEAINDGYIELKRTNIVRKIAFDNNLLDRMKSYAVSCNIISGAIFLTMHGKPVDRNAVWRIIRNTALLADIDVQKASASSLRKYYVRNHLKQNNDISALLEKLGFVGVSYKFEYPVSSNYERINCLNSLYD